MEYYTVVGVCTRPCCGIPHGHLEVDLEKGVQKMEQGRRRLRCEEIVGDVELREPWLVDASNAGASKFLGIGAYDDALVRIMIWA